MIRWRLQGFFSVGRVAIDDRACKFARVPKALRHQQKFDTRCTKSCLTRARLLDLLARLSDLVADLNMRGGCLQSEYSIRW
jgi:hypothetical protein